MSSRVRLGLKITALGAGVFSVFAFAVLADTEPAPQAQTRATIRGTGNDVSIVYRGTEATAPPRRLAPHAPAARVTAPATPVAPDLIAEATRMAEKGADDQSIINYFQNHQGELPDVVDNDAVRRLRKAGASPAVVSYLSRVSALDIGETAEGAPQYAYASQGESPGYSDYPSADSGYPFYGGYGGYGGYGSGGFGRFGHRNGGRFDGKRLGPPHHGMLPNRPVVSPHSLHAGGMRMGGTPGAGMRSGGSHVGTFRQR